MTKKEQITKKMLQFANTAKEIMTEFSKLSVAEQLEIINYTQDNNSDKKIIGCIFVEVELISFVYSVYKLRLELQDRI